MEDDNKNHMRKTTKAAIGFSAVMLSIAPLKQLKEFVMGDQVVTNARIEKTVNDGFARLEAKIEKHIDDDLVTHRRIRDLGTEEIASAEARCEKRSDKNEVRISNLELYAFKNFGPKRSTN